MNIEAVADSHLQSRNHVGLTVDRKTDVAYERGVEERIDDVAIVRGALGKALHAGARGHRNGAAPSMRSRVSDRLFRLLFHLRCPFVTVRKYERIGTLSDSRKFGQPDRRQYRRWNP